MNSGWHLYISLLKSFIRIVFGIYSIVIKDLNCLAMGIVIAEVLGILEEVNDRR